MSQPPVEVAPLGDRALVVRLGDRVSDEVFHRVRAVVERLRGAHPAIGDIVAGFTTVTVHYDPCGVRDRSGESPHVLLARSIEERLAHLDAAPAMEDRTVELPVCYSGELAPDLEEVSRHARLSQEDVVTLHTAALYTVQMIGFTPGFPYLAGLDPRLATPRRAEPRLRVAAGSVGIGGEQTGVYPMTTPGGWNIIGATPRSLFDPARDSPALLRIGDRVRFVAIARDEYDAILRR